jgi:ribosomal protein S12 methylthiotransferase accessory factor
MYVARQRALFFTGQGTVPFGARSNISTPTFEGDIEVVLGGLRRRGIEQAVIVDLTRSGLGIPVVKVTVPGLHIGNHARAPVPHDPAERRRFS